jgi:hypothetical protein
MRRILVPFLLATALIAISSQAVLAWPDDTQPQLSSRPDGTTAGGTWTVDISFVSGGRILNVDSFHPLVVIHETTTGASATFAAHETSVAGVFRAEVIFRAAGTWSYRVGPSLYGPFFDYPAIAIGSGAGATAEPAARQPLPGSLSLWLIAIASVLVGVATGVTFLIARKRRLVADSPGA